MLLAVLLALAYATYLLLVSIQPVYPYAGLTTISLQPRETPSIPE